MLVALSGLPGTGKTTIGRLLATKLGATFIRVDEIEHALKSISSCFQEIGPAGYVVAFAVARSNLQLGKFVIADSVNPVPESRHGWRHPAELADRPCIDVEVICSDVAEHRRRVESRSTDIDGFKLPTWERTISLQHQPWAEDRLLLDTARLEPSEAVARIETRIDAIVSSFPKFGLT